MPRRERDDDDDDDQGAFGQESLSHDALVERVRHISRSVNRDRRDREQADEKMESRLTALALANVELAKNQATIVSVQAQQAETQRLQAETQKNQGAELKEIGNWRLKLVAWIGGAAFAAGGLAALAYKGVELLTHH